MLPLVTGLLSGGASLLGSIFSSNTSASNTQANITAQQQAQAQSEQFNASQAEINREFQSQQSSTAYQRATADMKASGLNPMMMFGSGSSASTPGGSAASISTPNVSSINQKTSPLAGLGDAFKTGLTSMIDAKTIDVLGQKVANMQAEKSYTETITGKKAQDLNIDLPSETRSKALNTVLRNHPDLTTAIEATKYGADAVDKVGSAASSIVKPLVSAVGGLFSKSGRYPTRDEDISVGFDSSAKSRLRDFGIGRLEAAKRARQAGEMQPAEMKTRMDELDKMFGHHYND